MTGNPDSRPVPPRVAVTPPLCIAGLRDRYTAATRDTIPALWHRFAPYIGRVPGQIGQVAFGASLATADGAEGFDYLAGVEVVDGADLPSGLVQVPVPERACLVFVHQGHVSMLRQSLDAIWDDLLPGSGHKLAKVGPGEPGLMERYDDRFDPQTGNGDIEIWLPVEA